MPNIPGVDAKERAYDAIARRVFHGAAALIDEFEVRYAYKPTRVRLGDLAWLAFRRAGQTSERFTGGRDEYALDSVPVERDGLARVRPFGAYAEHETFPYILPGSTADGRLVIESVIYTRLFADFTPTEGA